MKKLKPRLYLYIICYFVWCADIPSGLADNGLTQIQENAKGFESRASEHRLNQKEPKGPQTLRATKLKESEAALKQQRKAEIFKMEASLVIYPVGSATVKKVGCISIATIRL
jgi:hypothetical protein